MNKPALYDLPDGVLALDGPIARPEPGTLPIRGDLAHIALAEKYLVAHYVMPQNYTVTIDAALRLSPDGDADTVTMLAAGMTFEALDFAGDWCWGCCGPDGPTGWVESKAIERVSA